MSADFKQSSGKYSCTQNRELSWLQFNGRILMEAEDETVPLLERFKFLSIFICNLDEFFMVRVGSLFDKVSVSPDERDNKSGWTAKEQLKRIDKAVLALNKRKDSVYKELTKQLAQNGIEEKTVSSMEPGERKFAGKYFKSKLLPAVSLQIADVHQHVLCLENKKLYLAAHLQDQDGREFAGLSGIPDQFPRVVVLPGEKLQYFRIEQTMLVWAGQLFDGYKVQECCILAVTRNADFRGDDEIFDEEDHDWCRRMGRLLKKRTRRSVVRMEIEGHISPGFEDILQKVTGAQGGHVFYSVAPLDLSYASELERFVSPKKKALFFFQPYEPRWAEDLDKEEGMMAQLQKNDRMLYFPYDSIEPFLKLLSEAAEHPHVMSIKITVYRLAYPSRIVQALCRAAKNGKHVTVLVELRARFDEEHNIFWSKVLKEAGCNVIYGVEYFKCHSKLLSIKYKEGNRVRYITQIGTGNYNEKTSCLYTDLSYMTASDVIGQDAAQFFKNMEAGKLDGKYSKLLVAPNGLKDKLLGLVDDEIAKGTGGYICIKANSLTDREMMDRLIKASSAGVEVQLILRGICCLRPGIPQKTENIHVTSIVGRFLEHARIYCFGRGEDVKLYISSSDLMTRNLQKRVEVACPVTEPYIRQQLLWILNVQLADNVKACRRLPDGSYECKEEGVAAIDSQEIFMQQSMHQDRLSHEGKSIIWKSKIVFSGVY